MKGEIILGKKVDWKSRIITKSEVYFSLKTKSDQLLLKELRSLRKSVKQRQLFTIIRSSTYSFVEQQSSLQSNESKPSTSQLKEDYSQGILSIYDQNSFRQFQYDYSSSSSSIEDQFDRRWEKIELPGRKIKINDYLNQLRQQQSNPE